MRAVIFGVDGLTFRILRPLMRRGDLPNFRRLREEGCEAVLESRYPPLTPPAWTSLSTGLKSAKHGVYDFWMYDEQQEGATRKTHVQTHRKGGKALWNILSEYGKRVLVLNVPATYPPDTVNGIMVSGYMTPGAHADFTYPRAFKEELYSVVPDYQIDLNMHDYERMKVSGSVGPLVDATLRMTERRIQLLMYLLKEKPWDFCFVAFMGSDRLQHPLWQEITALDAKATEYYRLLDHALGLVMEQLGPDDCLFVVSDHGFQGHSSYFAINEFLYSKGLLSMSPGFEASRRQASRSNRLKHITTQLGLRGAARQVKRSLKTAGLWRESGPSPHIDRPLLTEADWESTVASVPSFSGYQGGYADIFLSPDLEAGRIQELHEELGRQVDPKNGQPLIDAIYCSAEAFGTGPYAPREPHLILLPTEGITFNVDLGNERFWDDIGREFGSHQKDGVLYAFGGGIRRGLEAPNAEIYDLAPTVLRAMGLPLPHTFDGRVLHELFVERESAADAPLNASLGQEPGQAGRKLQKLLEA